MNHETNTQTLDIKTLIHLLMEEDMPHGRILSLIARECNLPEEKLMSAVTGANKPETTRKNIAWSDEAANRLIALWNGGEKPSKIAAQFGCSTQTVYQRVRILRQTRTDVMKRAYHGTRKTTVTE